jgi:hypothetical protein
MTCARLRGPEKRCKVLEKYWIDRPANEDLPRIDDLQDSTKDSSDHLYYRNCPPCSTLIMWLADLLAS